MDCYEIPKQLDEKTLNAARKELNEKDAKQVAADIEYIRDWILKQTYMKSRTDDAYILQFLRTAKYSYSRTQELIYNNCLNRTELKEFFHDRNLNDDSVLMEIADTELFFRLPQPDNEGRLVAIYRLGLWDPKKHDFNDIAKYVFLNMDALLEDPRGQINGLVLLMDLTGFSPAQVTEMSPSRAQKLTKCMQDQMPARIKSINYYNYPKIFDAAFSVVKMFLKEKIKKRLNFHGHSLSSVYKSIPKSILPTEYGGDAGPVKKINQMWVNHILSKKKILQDMESLSVDLSKAPKKETSNSAIGTAGTFRKLNVD